MQTLFLICPQRHFYELSTLVREFYPLARVLSQREENIPGLEVNDEETKADFLAEDGRLAAQEQMSVQDTFAYPSDPSKNRAKVLIFRLLCKVTALRPAWGILTGVRPTKIAYELLERGSVRETASVLSKGYLLRTDKAMLCAQTAERERKILSTHSPYDVSIYVNIPFCPTRCLYCSFISTDQKSCQKYGKDYVESLIKEFSMGRSLTCGRRIRSFYMGGGTPTTLSASELGRILEECDRQFDFSSLEEVTVEAGRPDTITREKVKVLKNCGVTRVSVNPQTMNQQTLDRIGRRHTVEQTAEAFALVREAGFFCVNMDLILGLAGEGQDEILHTLKEVSRLRPDNLTVHTLAVKRASRLNELGLGEAAISRDPEKVREKMDTYITLSQQTAAQMGMEPYYLYRQKNMAGSFENVGYTVPGRACLYNVEIMEERQCILGFGAGAVTKAYYPQTNRIERISNVKGIPEYLSRLDQLMLRKQEGFPVLSK